MNTKPECRTTPRHQLQFLFFFFFFFGERVFPILGNRESYIYNRSCNQLYCVISKVVVFYRGTHPRVVIQCSTCLKQIALSSVGQLSRVCKKQQT
jgi:hypothetical protein